MYEILTLDPANITKLQTGVAAVHAAGRNYFAGEYDWLVLLSFHPRC